MIRVFATFHPVLAQLLIGITFAVAVALLAYGCWPERRTP